MLRDAAATVVASCRVWFMEGMPGLASPECAVYVPQSDHAPRCWAYDANFDIVLRAEVLWGGSILASLR